MEYMMYRELSDHVTIRIMELRDSEDGWGCSMDLKGPEVNYMADNCLYQG